MLLLKNGFFGKKIETWHVGLSCQYTHFMSFLSKSEHDTIADQATLTSHFLLYLQNYKEFEAEILDLQIEKYGLSFDTKNLSLLVEPWGMRMWSA